MKIMGIIFMRVLILWEFLVIGLQDFADFWLCDHPIATLLILGSFGAYIVWLMV